MVGKDHRVEANLGIVRSKDLLVTAQALQALFKGPDMFGVQATVQKPRVPGSRPRGTDV